MRHPELSRRRFIERASAAAGASVVAAMLRERLVHTVDQPKREPQVGLVTAHAAEREQVADRECIRPEIANLGPVRVQTGALGERLHELGRF